MLVDDCTLIGYSLDRKIIELEGTLYYERRYNTGGNNKDEKGNWIKSEPVCSILWNTNKNVSKMGTERKYASSIYSGMMSYILHLEKRVKELEERLSKYEEPGKDVAEVQ